VHFVCNSVTPISTFHSLIPSILIQLELIMAARPGERKSFLTDLSAFFLSSFKSSDAEEAEDNIEETGVGAPDVGSLRRLLQAQAVHRQAELSDGLLAKCINFRPSDLNRCAEVAKGLLKFRLAENWPLRIPSDSVNVAGSTGIHWILQRRPASGNHDEHGDGPAAVVVFNVSRLNTSVCSVEEYQKFSTFIMERLTDDIEVQRRGISLIVDFGHNSFSKLSSLVALEDIKRGVRLWKGAFPCRLRGIWLVDTPGVLNLMLWSVLKMLSPTVRERVQHTSRSSGLHKLRESLGRRFELPISLGGEIDLDAEWDATWNNLFEDPKTTPTTSSSSSSTAGLQAQELRLLGCQTYSEYEHLASTRGLVARCCCECIAL